MGGDLTRRGLLVDHASSDIAAAVHTVEARTPHRLVLLIGITNIGTTTTTTTTTNKTAHPAAEQPAKAALAVYSVWSLAGPASLVFPAAAESCYRVVDMLGEVRPGHSCVGAGEGS